MTTLDRRLHAFRDDLAERGLEGQVTARRFTDGTPARIAVPVVGLRPRRTRPSVSIPNSCSAKT